MGLLKNILNNHHADKRFPQNQQHFHLILKKHFRLKIVNANTIEKNSKNFFFSYSQASTTEESKCK